MRWIVLAAALASLPAEGAPFIPRGAASSRAEKAEVRLGEPFRYELEIQHPAAEAWSLPEAPALEPFRASDPACRTEARGDEATTTCTLRLALFRLGPHDVPAVPLVASRDGASATVAVPGPRVTGLGMIDPEAADARLTLRDPAGPVPLLVRSLRFVLLGLGALAAILLAVLGLRALRRRASPDPAPREEAPPHVVFGRRLDALEAERLPARGLGREHVAQVSELARGYVAAITLEPALDLTTGELVERLAAGGDPRLDLAALRGFLEGADLVKFAKGDADEARCAAATGFARELLRRTAPPPLPEGP